MRSEVWFWPFLALLLLLVAPEAPQSVIASSSVGLAVDAVPGGGVDSVRAVPDTAPFDVDIVIVEASTPYAGYQYKLQWDAGVLAYDGEMSLESAGLTLCAVPSVSGNTVLGGCANDQGTLTFTGPVNRVTFHCLGTGTSPIHLVTLAEDASFGSVALTTGGVQVDTTLADAQITCGAGGVAPISTPTTGPAATPEGPVATPTPLPPGFEAVNLTAGCNPVTTTYDDDTSVATLDAAVGPAGNLEGLWAFEGGTWLGYSPAYPQASDLSSTGFLDVVFVCVGAPGHFVRPVV